MVWIINNFFQEWFLFFFLLSANFSYQTLKNCYLDSFVVDRTLDLSAFLKFY